MARVRDVGKADDMSEEQVTAGMAQGCHACMEISATGNDDANGIPHTCMPKPTEIETPAAAAALYCARRKELSAPQPSDYILADRKQIAAWLIEHAEAAEREAPEHVGYRAGYLEGQAVAWRGLASRLKVTP